jgi:hypothetical protein
VSTASIAAQISIWGSSKKRKAPGEAREWREVGARAARTAAPKTTRTRVRTAGEEECRAMRRRTTVGTRSSRSS